MRSIRFLVLFGLQLILIGAFFFAVSYLYLNIHSCLGIFREIVFQTMKGHNALIALLSAIDFQAMSKVGELKFLTPLWAFVSKQECNATCFKLKSNEV
jgi:hypothetical protein